MAKNLLSYVKSRRSISLVLIVAILLFLSIIFRGTRMLFFIIFFISLNLAITSYRRFIYLPIEIETLSFGIVLSGAVFGFGAGMLIAVLGGLLYIILSNNFSPFSVPMLGGYIIMAAASSVINLQNIILAGIAVNLLHNVFVFMTYHLFFRYDLSKNLLFSISNILFNALLFINFSHLALRIMA